MAAHVLHLAERSVWASVTGPDGDGFYRVSTRGRTLADEGFLHASTSRQLPGVVQRFYADVDPADFLVLVIDVDRCESGGTPVRWDPVGNDVFPHLYGPLAATAVVATVALPVRDGRLDAEDLVAALAGLDVLDQPPAP